MVTPRKAWLSACVSTWLSCPGWARPGGGSSFHSSSSRSSGSSYRSSGSSYRSSGYHSGSHGGGGTPLDGETIMLIFAIIGIALAVLLVVYFASNRSTQGRSYSLQSSPSTSTDWGSSPSLSGLANWRVPKWAPYALPVLVFLFIFSDLFRALIMIPIFLMIPFLPAVLGAAGLAQFLKNAGVAFNATATALGGPLPVLQPLLEDDPNFSLPVFREFAVLLYSQALLERPAGFPHSRPYLSQSVVKTLGGRSRASSVTDVVVGTCLLQSARLEGDLVHLRVRFESNYLEKAGASEQAIVANETWTFTRKKGSLTTVPEGPSKLACPGCGFAGDFPSDGQCPQCSRTNSQGQLDWVVANILVQGLEPFKPHQAEGAGVEVGTNLSTLVHPQLPVRKRELEARHPDFSMGEFENKVREVFFAINEAWSERDWARARPFESDAIFRTHRYWIEDYLRKGQINKLDRIQLTKIVLSNIVLDAFYESITVRLYASMADYTVDAATGKVLFGDAKNSRSFSEYWTFIRRVGHHKARSAGCPSCGASLDRVNQAGICEYCDSLITKGDFGWVLSNIEQDEVYRLSF